MTGATGWVGSAIVRELLEEGYQVRGLARNDASAETLTKLGVEVHRGDITDTDSLVSGTRKCDGVIHTAFIHDFSRFESNVEVDRRAVEAMASALEGSDKPFVITSGTMMVAVGRTSMGTEKDAPVSPAIPRSASEAIVLAAAGRGVRSSVVRLSPSVHGRRDHGFVPFLVDIARRKGFSAYVGEGANRWPAVHLLDAAHLFRLALENASPGTRLHAAARRRHSDAPDRRNDWNRTRNPLVRSISQDQIPAISNGSPRSSLSTARFLAQSPAMRLDGTLYSMIYSRT